MRQRRALPRHPQIDAGGHCRPLTTPRLDQPASLLFFYPAGGRMSSLDAIRQFAAEEFEVGMDTIDVDAPFDQIGIDSLGLVEFIFELEDKFNVRLAADKTEGLNTLRDLANHVDSLLADKESCVVSS
jgi:acyl carrier protein